MKTARGGQGERTRETGRERVRKVDEIGLANGQKVATKYYLFSYDDANVSIKLTSI